MGEQVSGRVAGIGFVRAGALEHGVLQSCLQAPLTCPAFA